MSGQGLHGLGPQVQGRATSNLISLGIVMTKMATGDDRAMFQHSGPIFFVEIWADHLLLCQGMPRSNWLCLFVEILIGWLWVQITSNFGWLTGLPLTKPKWATYDPPLYWTYPSHCCWSFPGSLWEYEKKWSNRSNLKKKAKEIHSSAGLNPHGWWLNNVKSPCRCRWNPHFFQSVPKIFQVNPLLLRVTFPIQVVGLELFRWGKSRYRRLWSLWSCRGPRS